MNTEQRQPRQGMSIIVRTVARLTAGFAILFGAYLALNNASIPAGGAAGGIIIAVSFIFLLLAFGKGTKQDLQLKNISYVTGGTGIVLLVSALCLGLSAVYFFIRFSGREQHIPFIRMIDVDLLLKAGVAAAVLAVILAIVSYGMEKEGKL